jgi:hypothetical protein
MATTDTADYKFTVKEGEASKEGADDAPVWLMCEPMKKELNCVGDGYLAIRLRRDIRVREAEEIARYLQDCVIGFSHTRF